MWVTLRLDLILHLISSPHHPSCGFTEGFIEKRVLFFHPLAKCSQMAPELLSSFPSLSPNISFYSAKQSPQLTKINFPRKQLCNHFLSLKHTHGGGGGEVAVVGSTCVLRLSRHSFVKNRSLREQRGRCRLLTKRRFPFVSSDPRQKPQSFQLFCLSATFSYKI